jgi:hypothetical protein
VNLRQAGNKCVDHAREQACHRHAMDATLQHWWSDDGNLPFAYSVFEVTVEDARAAGIRL